LPLIACLIRELEERCGHEILADKATSLDVIDPALTDKTAAAAAAESAAAEATAALASGRVLKQKDLQYCFSAAITAAHKSGQVEEALKLWDQMLARGVKPNEVRRVAPDLSLMASLMTSLMASGCPFGAGALRCRSPGVCLGWPRVHRTRSRPIHSF
jgi:pentatricopeptide repeat protein